MIVRPPHVACSMTINVSAVVVWAAANDQWCAGTIGAYRRAHRWDLSGGPCAGKSVPNRGPKSLEYISPGQRMQNGVIIDLQTIYGTGPANKVKRHLTWSDDCGRTLEFVHPIPARQSVGPPNRSSLLYPPSQPKEIQRINRNNDHHR